MARESYESLKKYIITSVLNVACPHINWYQEDIVRIHRVGQEVADNPDNPRIMLIKFLHWDKKMAVLKGRDKLREAGIRVGDDLTRRQRATLKHPSNKGQLGYFYKGEHFIRDNKKDPPDVSDKHSDKIQTRTFVKAFRKTVHVQSPYRDRDSVLNSFFHKPTFGPIRVGERIMSMTLKSLLTTAMRICNMKF